MRIERIDDKTVKCFLSNEELEEYQIDYKDFITRSDKAREVVHDIMEQAKEEVGYTPPKYAFDLQIMMLPDKGLLLTFSEKDPFEGKDGGPLLDYLKEMQDVLTKNVQGQPEKQTSEKADALKEKKAEELPRPEKAIFVFERMQELLDYAQVVPKTLRAFSSLYLVDGEYYLYLEKGKASYEKYSKACIQAMEYAAIYGAEEDKMIYVREHGECLIAEYALRKLHTVG